MQSRIAQPICTLLWVQERAAKEAEAKAGGGAAAVAPGGGAAAGGGDDGPGSTPHRHKRPPVWQLITSNMYTFRERKEQDEDDIMICQVGAAVGARGSTHKQRSSVACPGLPAALASRQAARAQQACPAPQLLSAAAACPCWPPASAAVQEDLGHRPHLSGLRP